MKLWLDDLRPVPYGRLWIMIWEIMRIRAANTANPVGRANMERILARYWGEQYW